MPRVARKDLGTSFFHIIVQGINKEYIFEKSIYMQQYKKLLFKYQDKYTVRILAYCIMNNHAHILLYTDKIEKMSYFMKEVNSRYASYYNYKEDRIGYVFRDRYLSQPIYNETYLLKCISYIHFNPVKANIVSKCSDYVYSSYNDYIHKNGVGTKENRKMLFGTEDKYIDIYMMIHNNIEYFLDIDLNISEILDKKIQKYERKTGKDESEITKDSHSLKDLIKELKEDQFGIKITNKEIAKRLNINISKIKRLSI